MIPFNLRPVQLIRSSVSPSRILHASSSKHLISSCRRGAKMWVAPPQKTKVAQENVGSLVDSLRLIKALKIDQPDLPIELTIEPLMKKTVNSNVLKGRYVLPNPIPTPSSSSSLTPNGQADREVIAVILDDESTEDVGVAKQLGLEHYGGQDLLDKILAEELKPTKLLVHSKSPRIQNLFTSSESKKTLFKNLARLNLIIPSEKRGTMGEDLTELVKNSQKSIDWMLKKKPLRGQLLQPSPESVPSPSGAPKVKATLTSDRKTKGDIDSFVSISVGSIQMNLIEIEQNVSDFLSLISNLTQFGSPNPNQNAQSTLSNKLSPAQPANLESRATKFINFKSGRPIKKPGIHKATLSVKGIPPITVI